MGLFDKFLKKDETAKKDSVEKAGLETKIDKAKEKTEKSKETKKSVLLDSSKEKITAGEKAGKKSAKKGKGKLASKSKKIIGEKIPVQYYDIIQKPHISEKAFNLGGENKYVFVVSKSANKSEIKKAVESLYRVAAVDVNIVKAPAKPKRFRGVPTVKSGYKKAVVTLAKGYSIDMMKGL